MALKLSTTTVSQVPVKSLLPDPNQPRETFEENALKALADNIKARGVQVPLLVRMGASKGQIIIKDGERRWRAAKLLKLKTVPCLLVKDSDAAQIRIDQVTVNNLRERLKPMELAKTLARMRDEEKLTVNDIAAKLAKQGVAISRSEIENLVKLVALPAWAQEMVNAEQIDISSARELVGITDKAVLANVKSEIERDIKWRGRVLPREATQAVRVAYRSAAAADLTNTDAWRSDVVLFDYRKVCKGCPHLRVTHGEALCMDKAGFAKHQAEAKEAGLGPGGAQPKKSSAKAAGDRPPTPAQQRKAEEKKAELRAESLENKSRAYLHQWVNARIREKLPTAHPDVLLRLVEFSASRYPALSGYRGAGVEAAHERKLKAAARGAGFKAFGVFLLSVDAEGPRALHLAIAEQVLDHLPLPESLLLAHHLMGKDITPLWTLTPGYLDLLQKAELAEVAGKHAQLPEGKKAWSTLKTDELQAAILAVAERIPVPPMIARLYAEPELPDSPDGDEDNDHEGSMDDSGDDDLQDDND